MVLYQGFMGLRSSYDYNVTVAQTARVPSIIVLLFSLGGKHIISSEAILHPNKRLHFPVFLVRSDQVIKVGPGKCKRDSVGLWKSFVQEADS